MGGGSAAAPPVNSREFREALDAFARRSRIERNALENALLEHYATAARWHAETHFQDVSEPTLRSARTALTAVESWALNGRKPMRPFYAAPTRIAIHEIVAFDEETLIVSRVVDPGRAIVSWQVVEHRGGYFADVSDGKPSKYRPPTRRTISTDFLIAGIETSRLVEGETYTGPRILFASGTARTRGMGGGGRPLLLLEPIDLTPHMERFTQWDQARAWTSRDGDELDKAVLGGFARNRVALVDRDGVRRTLDFDKLSEADREFVRDWRRSNDPVLLAGD